MEISQFKYQASEIQIDKKSIAGLIGYPTDDIPEMIMDIIHSEIENLPKTNEIEGGYLVKNCQLNHEENYLTVDGVNFDIGKKVIHLMRNTEMIAIFACTAGYYVSQRSKELMGNGDVLEGYVVDVIGSVLVEAAMDKIQDSIKVRFEDLNLKTSNRYSPGYCEWLVSEQRKLFSFLPEGFCGITLSDSALMLPIKSVSGFIGIGEKVKYNPYTCDICTQSKCLYRNMNSNRTHLA